MHIALILYHVTYFSNWVTWAALAMTWSALAILRSCNRFRLDLVETCTRDLLDFLELQNLHFSILYSIKDVLKDQFKVIIIT